MIYSGGQIAVLSLHIYGGKGRYERRQGRKGIGKGEDRMTGRKGTRKGGGKVHKQLSIYSIDRWIKMAELHHWF